MKMRRPRISCHKGSVFSRMYWMSWEETGGAGRIGAVIDATPVSPCLEGFGQAWSLPPEEPRKYATFQTQLRAHWLNLKVYTPLHRGCGIVHPCTGKRLYAFSESTRTW